MTYEEASVFLRRLAPIVTAARSDLRSDLAAAWAAVSREDLPRVAEALQVVAPYPWTREAFAKIARRAEAEIAARDLKGTIA
jgi:hypothetical protein